MCSHERPQWDCAAGYVQLKHHQEEQPEKPVKPSDAALVRLCGTGPQVQLIKLDAEAAGAEKKS